MLRSRSVRPRHAVACSGLRLAVAALLSPISVKDVLPSDGTYKQSPAPGDRVRDNLFMRRMANLFTASAFSDFAILQVEEDHQLEHSSHSPESDQHKRTPQSNHLISVNVEALDYTPLNSLLIAHGQTANLGIWPAEGGR